MRFYASSSSSNPGVVSSPSRQVRQCASALRRQWELLCGFHSSGFGNSTESLPDRQGGRDLLHRSNKLHGEIHVLDSRLSAHWLFRHALNEI